MFNQFVKLSGIKRILSFGGWGFSTDPSTYNVFRQGVTSGNFKTMAQNVVNFIVQNNLDGVDFDWEYPGEPDIPGIPAGSSTDGFNYLVFLAEVRVLLPVGKTLSIAAPASYWYLRGFPIAQISSVVDYIVFMTYDLHGQWDYGNTWADPGCSTGSCLRSHVNWTETGEALGMITRAGVQSNKIVVGMASYGRSFQMATPGCSDFSCKFTGPLSGAVPGICTNTAGMLSNGEINYIQDTDNTTVTLYDVASDSYIMMWDSDQWVAYLGGNSKVMRTEIFQAWNFLGTVEWATNLDAIPNGIDSVDYNCTLYSASSPDEMATANIPSSCFGYVLFNLMGDMINEAASNYTSMMSNGYQNLFSKYYQPYIYDNITSVYDNFMFGPYNDLQQMQNVTEVAKQIEAADEKAKRDFIINLILSIVAVVVGFAVPGVGGAL
ncbi:hypothetical protein GGI04_001535, partial [Coemansia thaxteri]